LSLLLQHAAKIKAHELRGKNKQELINQVINTSTGVCGQQL
jgi:hypothetical protein